MATSRLSRRGYAQNDAENIPVEKPGIYPDTFAFGSERQFPDVLLESVPLRERAATSCRCCRCSSTASMRRGCASSVHARKRRNLRLRAGIGPAGACFSRARLTPFGDARDAGFGDTAQTATSFGASDHRCNSQRLFGDADSIPLFSEVRADASVDATRNPYMMYQPMTRLRNLVTTHSNVYAIWITVGYFEVEKRRIGTIRQHQENGHPAAIRGDEQDERCGHNCRRALYDRVYPDGYMLGKEVGSDTGNTRRQRGFT